MLSNKCSRRSLLTGIILAPVLFIAFKKKPAPEQTINCPDQNSLNEEQKAIRQNLKYVDQTPITTRRCDNCKLYTITKPDSCGGCKIVPGPIHPAGYCISWYQMM